MVSEEVAVKISCKTLSVSRSGYYSWLTRPEPERQKENAVLIAEIKAIHDESRKTYGVPRVHAKLMQLGRRVGKNRVSSLMQKTGISGLIKRRFKIKTTDSNHDSPIADRIFKTEVIETHPTKPNKAWASDISYIFTDEGVLYLGTYLDLCSRKVVGFAIEDHMRTELLQEALDMAIGRQMGAHSGVIGHSDRGSQYALQKNIGKN